MTRRDDAIKAAARALWATGGTSWEEANADEREYHRDCAEAALDAALAVLQPTIPNTTEDLEALPVGTIIRADGAAYVHTDAWEWVETVTGQAWTVDELAAHHHPRWHVIHTPEETA